MSTNKQAVEKYMDGFNKTDHAQILSCLTDDVEWKVPGAFHVFGKAAFDKQIEGEGFIGSPVVVTSRLTEENGVVIAEGTVLARKTDGTEVHLLMCDVFVMQNGLIKSLTSFLAPAN